MILYLSYVERHYEGSQVIGIYTVLEAAMEKCLQEQHKETHAYIGIGCEPEKVCIDLDFSVSVWDTEKQEVINYFVYDQEHPSWKSKAEILAEKAHAR